MSLTLTSCPSETFTCKSGDCIPLANKCNSRIDCDDASDELSCSYLEVHINYQNSKSKNILQQGYKKAFMSMENSKITFVKTT